MGQNCRNHVLGRRQAGLTDLSESDSYFLATENRIAPPLLLERARRLLRWSAGSTAFETAGVIIGVQLVRGHTAISFRSRWQQKSGLGRRMTLVFVYGTLKRGQPNHALMLDESVGAAQLLASVVTTETFPLVIAGERNVPFLLNLPGRGRRVHGELYRVDERLLRFLDVFEDTPAMYQRTPLTLTVKEWLGRADDGQKTAAGGVAEAFVYSTTTYRPDWPSLPHHDNYDSRGHHGLEYVRK